MSVAGGRLRKMATTRASNCRPAFRAGWKRLASCVIRAPVGAIGGHRIVSIDHVNDARVDGRLGARLAFGVAGAIPVFVVQFDGAEVRREALHALEYAAADDRMLLDEDPLFFGEAAGLLQHTVRDADFGRCRGVVRRRGCVRRRPG